MSKYFYFFSNGRCGTQFLARQLGQLAQGEWVAHEAVPLAYKSRDVFRDIEKIYSEIGRSPTLQRHLVRVDRNLNRGTRFIHCGWPAFGWVPYFQERYGENFQFVHLVRNPYKSAASHATHQLMSDVNQDVISRHFKLYAQDPRMQFTQFREAFVGFNTFERQLYHWLEITKFGLELRELSGFAGVFRFEDIIGPDAPRLDDLLSLALGRKVSAKNVEPFDRVHRASPWRHDFSVAAELRSDVDAMALSLGYTQSDLDAALDPKRLSATYSATRLQGMACDPDVPVVDSKK